MPYDVVRGHGCPPSKPWAVVKSGTGERMGCHSDRQGAEDQRKALYAAETTASPWSITYHDGRYRITAPNEHGVIATIGMSFPATDEGWAAAVAELSNLWHRRLPIIADGMPLPPPPGGRPFTARVANVPLRTRDTGMTRVADSLAVASLPRPWMLCRYTDTGHRGAVIAGRIDLAETADGWMDVRGWYDGSPEGAEAARLADTRVMPYVSVDLQFDTAMFTCEVEDGDGDCAYGVLRIPHATVLAVTQLPTNAVQEAQVTWVGPPLETATTPLPVAAAADGSGYAYDDPAEAIWQHVADAAASGELPHIATRSVQTEPAAISLPVDGATCIRSVSGRMSESSLWQAPEGLVIVSAWRDGDVTVRAYSADRTAAAALAVRQAAAYPAPAPLADGEVRMRFWFMTGMGPSTRTRRLVCPSWVDIAGNYPAEARAQLAGLTTLRAAEADAGRLVLAFGEPGTGKSYALRALAREWAPFADVHYITDPDELLADASYLTQLLADDTSEGRWRIVIMEDAGEFVSDDAKLRSGAGLGRLLNAADGMLGQGTRTIFVLTTNEDVTGLHPAITRPGRCLASLHLGAFPPGEAAVWLGEPVEVPMTLAAMWERKHRPKPVAAVAEPEPCCDDCAARKQPKPCGCGSKAEPVPVTAPVSAAVGIAACAALPVLPSAAFRRPDIDGAIPLTIAETGGYKIGYGHLHEFGECLRNGYGCTSIPPGDDFAEFLLAEMPTDAGSVLVGPLLFDGPHADVMRDTPQSAAELHSNTANVAGAVTVGQDEFGYWMAGVLSPDLTEGQLFRILACGQVSGEWWPARGRQRLHAVLTVPTPGFPKRRTGVVAGRMERGPAGLGLAAAITVGPRREARRQVERETLRAGLSRLAAQATLLRV